MITSKSKAFVILALVIAVGAKAAAPTAAQAQTRASSRSRPEAGEHTQPPSEAEYYSCPMHPEVKAKKAGRCPKCGMALRPTRAEPQAPADTSAGASLAVSAPAATPAGRQPHFTPGPQP